MLNVRTERYFFMACLANVLHGVALLLSGGSSALRNSTPNTTVAEGRIDKVPRNTREYDGGDQYDEIAYDPMVDGCHEFADAC